jgi:23S rRNA pseudouridine2605 synthase
MNTQVSIGSNSSSRELRLQKFIADCGVTSRRKAEEMIEDGRVEVNGQIVTQLGTKVNPKKDSVLVDGRPIDLGSVNNVYLVFHKPRCVMTTVSDPEGRPTVLDYCKDINERIYPVGRLDYLSEGLLILTNDGEVGNMIMHPSSNVEKVYEVKVFGIINEQILKGLRAGATVEGETLVPKSVRLIKQLPGKTWLEFRLNEGKNREIRKLCEAVGVVVDKLKRVSIGGLSIDGISPGRYRMYNKNELLKEIGFMKNTHGYTLVQKEFVSAKKSIRFKKRQNFTGTLANERVFQQYNRDIYFETIKKKKELAQQILDEEAAAAANNALVLPKAPTTLPKHLDF